MELLKRRSCRAVDVSASLGLSLNVAQEIIKSLRDEEDLDKEILRAGMIAELDAVSLYDQMAALTAEEKTRKVLLEIAREEKTHAGEFLTLLLERDEEQWRELDRGREEAGDIK